MSIPLPPPVAYGATDLEDGRIYDAWYEPIEGCTVPLHTADQLHAHAAAVSAAKDARIKVLESALRAICSEQDARQGYASVETYDAARAALGDKTPNARANLTDTASAGLPGYTAGDNTE